MNFINYDTFQTWSIVIISWYSILITYGACWMFDLNIYHKLKTTPLHDWISIAGICSVVALVCVFFVGLNDGMNTETLILLYRAVALTSGGVFFITAAMYLIGFGYNLRQKILANKRSNLG